MMIYFSDTQTTSSVLQNTNQTLKHISESFFSVRSLGTLIIAIVIAMILGRIAASFLRRLTSIIGARVDETKDITQVNRLRRIETLIVLSIAFIRTLLVLLAFYFWWAYTHPHGQPTALLGASAVVAILLSATLTPVLRDLSYGGVMMAEHWFGVGDFIRIDPFSDMEGVVERVTLRSTRIRGINGEVIWVSNQNIQAIRLTPKGVRTIALELVVSDPDRGVALIKNVNLRLPTNPLMLASPLQIITKEEMSDDLWHITVLGETAPGREWILEDYAVTIIKEVDAASKHPVLLHSPIARYADREAERKFARTIKNARKTTVARKKPSAKSPSTKKRRFI